MRCSADKPPLRLQNVSGIVRVEDDRIEADVRAALKVHKGNKSRAALALGISRHALSRLAKKHGPR